MTIPFLQKDMSFAILKEKSARVILSAEKAKELKVLMVHHSGKPDWDVYIPCMDRDYVIKLAVTDWSCKVH